MLPATLEAASGACYNCTSIEVSYVRYAYGRIFLKVRHVMNPQEIMQSFVAEDRGHPEIRSGDTVKVHLRIVEGDRERVQIFQGIVIRLRGGGNEANFTVRRVATHGVGVERTFLLKSPRIEKIEILRRAKVRRAQLYYLRDLRGKKARLKEKRD